MNIRRIFFSIFFSLCGVAALAQNTFAIVIDSESYSHCKAEVDAYAAAVDSDGLKAVVLAQNWANPEQVKSKLLELYSKEELEGAVFIGDIPIPMVRKAQHLASAFKMDEAEFSLNESSVPSDRFYDDFDLKFDYIGQDGERSDLFYYELAPDSPQYILSDIYTGRICPRDIYCDRYEELSSYLTKVVEAKKAVQAGDPEYRMDKITSYTGEGSFSNSLISWKDESITLDEQFPEARGTKDGIKFYIFEMYPFVKDVMLKEICRDDLDLVFFHEHGMPDRQYLSAYPAAYEDEEYLEKVKYTLRDRARFKVLRGATQQEAIASVAESYGVSKEWVADAFDPEVAAADSLIDARTGIMLPDIQKAAPNVKISIFDACYNGDFREPDCIASRYILAPGKSLIAIGNSVNVLQDKSSSDLLGMLSAGYRVGEWMEQTNILESHILGDPSFRFLSSYDFERPKLDEKSVEYWTKYLKGDYPDDIQGLALHKLHALGAPKMSDLILQTYRNSDSYMLRLQCLHLCAEYNDGNYTTLLEEAADDPYEFIRRRTAYYMGRVGSDELARPLADMYLRDYNAKRMAFNVSYSCAHFADGVFDKAFDEALSEADFLFDKEAFAASAREKFAAMKSIADGTGECLAHKEWSDRRRDIYIANMRNNPYPKYAPELLDIVKDAEQSENMRTRVAEVLGWYVRAYNRAEIISSLEEYLASGETLPEGLRKEIVRTINRLKVYMK